MSELDELKRKLAAREGKPQFKENVELLRERIAWIEAGKPPLHHAETGRFVSGEFARMNPSHIHRETD